MTKHLVAVSLSLMACLYVGERTSGMNKICYYDCVSGQMAITISSTKLCPLTLKE